MMRIMALHGRARLAEKWPTGVKAQDFPSHDGRHGEPRIEGILGCPLFFFFYFFLLRDISNFRESFFGRPRSQSKGAL